jgi:16S rRNA (uracil1498-N3)-methyltransferase
MYPLETERTIKEIRSERAADIYERWHKIALGAAEQSCGLRVPCVHPVMTLDALLSRRESFHRVCVAQPGTALSWLSVLDEARHSAQPLSILVIIGPEGGFDPAEYTVLTQSAQPISLGNRILKTDTAAIALLSVLAVMGLN